MTQHRPIIDVENPAILNEPEWMGTGKSYREEDAEMDTDDKDQ
jgi:hypothetical protein